MLEGIELDWLRLVEVAFLGPVQSWCEEGKVAFLTDLLNDDGFNPSSVTGMCFIHSWERMRRTAFARRQRQI